MRPPVLWRDINQRGSNAGCGAQVPTSPSWPPTAGTSWPRLLMMIKPAPLEKKLVGAHLRLVGVEPRRKKPVAGHSDAASGEGRAVQKPAADLLAFPAGSLQYGSREAAFLAIGRDKGAPWDVDMMAGEFRRGCPDIDRRRTEKEWLRMWESFVTAFAKRRRQSQA